MTSKVCDDLENLPAQRIHNILSKNLIPKNNFRRLSFESRHSLNIVDSCSADGMRLRRASLQRRKGGILELTTSGKR